MKISVISLAVLASCILFVASALALSNPLAELAILPSASQGLSLGAAPSGAATASITDVLDGDAAQEGQWSTFALQQQPTVPEPAALLMMLCGGTLAGVRSYRKRQLLRGREV